MEFGVHEAFDRLFCFTVLNNSGEIIPPYACMELDYAFESGKNAFEVVDSALIVHVKKPTADNIGSPERFVINGPQSIAIDGHGTAYKLPVLQALMDIATPPALAIQLAPRRTLGYLLQVDQAGKLRASILVMPMLMVTLPLYLLRLLETLRGLHTSGLRVAAFQRQRTIQLPTLFQLARLFAQEPVRLQRASMSKAVRVIQ